MPIDIKKNYWGNIVASKKGYEDLVFVRLGRVDLTDIFSDRYCVCIGTQDTTRTKPKEKEDPLDTVLMLREESIVKAKQLHARLLTRSALTMVRDIKLKEKLMRLVIDLPEKKVEETKIEKVEEIPPQISTLMGEKYQMFIDYHKLSSQKMEQEAKLTEEIKKLNDLLKSERETHEFKIKRLVGDYEVKSIRSQMEIEKMKILIESKDSVLAETLAELCLERENRN